MTSPPPFVVFIDFDGVTHPLRDRTPKRLDDPLMGVEWFCPDNVSQINRLLGHLNAVGVISSAWRLDFPWEAFQGYFEHRLVGRNPLLDGVQRLAECRLFLEQMGWRDLPWVAIDDKPLLFSPDAPLIATDYRTGLKNVDVDRFLQSAGKLSPGPEQAALREYYCTSCHHPFVAVNQPVGDTNCPACGAIDHPAVRRMSSNGYMYYLKSDAGRAEMQRSHSKRCYAHSCEVVLYDKSPLLADAVRIGTSGSANRNTSVLPIAGSAGPVHQGVPHALQERARGVIVGLAVGDAMGMPLEFMSKQQIQRQHGGKVREYVKPIPRHPCEHLSPGQYTDDTQMAMALAKSIIDKGEFSPHAFKRRLIEWYECKDHRAPGNACIQAVARLDQGVSYKESGQENAAGCGSAMRVAPLALVYGGKELIKHSHLQSIMTHQDVRASIGTVLTAQIVSRLLAMDAVSFDRDDFLKEITRFAAALEEKLGHRKPEFSEKLATFPDLLAMPFEESIVKIGTGGYVVETVLGAFFGFLHSPTDFEATIVNVVNEGHDADSVGAIAGAFSGAFNGLGAIPARWLAPLEGRDELIAVADGLSRLKTTMQAESAST